MKSVARTTFCFFISFLMALAPFTLSLCKCYEKVDISALKAYAEETEGAEFSFIERCARDAGLSSGDWIATVVGAGSVATGYSLLRGDNAAIAMGSDAATALDNLADAADYPAWDTLTAEQQQTYGSKKEYDATKFNSLMNAFGMGSDHEAYIQGFTSTGGGTFEWSTGAQRQLDRLGRIGALWAAGASNLVSSILETVTDTEEIETYVGANITYTEYENDNYSWWPYNISSPVYINRGNNFLAYKADNSVKLNILTSTDVYWICFYRTGSVFVGVPFSDQGFMWGQTFSASTPTLSSSPQTYTENGKTIYFTNPGVQIQNGHCNMQLSTISDTYTANAKMIAWHWLNDGGTFDTVDKMADYPDTLDDTQPIYYPVNGITSTTNWNDFTDDSGSGSAGTDYTDILNQILAQMRTCCERFQFYTTGQLKVHDEGIFDQLTDIQTTLNQILAKIGLSTDAPDIIGEFDYPELQTKSNDLVEDISTLAPFGSMLVISETIGILSQTEQITEPKLDVPFKFGLNQDYSVEIDLSWLDPLKPLINALLIMVLVMTLAGVTLRFVELEASA